MNMKVEEDGDTTPDLAEAMAETANKFPDDGSGDVPLTENVELEGVSTDGVEGEAGTGETSEEAGAEKTAAEAAEASGEKKDEVAEGEPDFSFADDPEWRGSLKEQTRERFDTLLADRKKSKEELDSLNEQFAPAKEFRETWTQALHSSQMGQDDVNWMLTANRLMKSDDLQDNLKAAEMVDALKAQLDQRLGRGGNPRDVLGQHPDLVEKVNKYQLSAEDALEIAQSRNAKHIQQEYGQRQQQQTQEQANFQAAFNQASAQIVALENEWSGSDPLYVKKQAAIVQYTEGLINNGVAPNRWAGMINEEYKRISELAKQFSSASGALRPNSSTPSALRPTGASPHNDTAIPKDMNDALTQELERMRGT